MGRGGWKPCTFDQARYLADERGQIMKRWWNDLCDAWYYLRRTMRVAHGKRLLPESNGVRQMNGEN
jgi:hypothetical protein